MAQQLALFAMPASGAPQGAPDAIRLGDTHGLTKYFLTRWYRDYPRDQVESDRMIDDLPVTALTMFAALNYVISVHIAAAMGRANDAGMLDGLHMMYREKDGVLIPLPADTFTVSCRWIMQKMIDRTGQPHWGDKLPWASYKGFTEMTYKPSGNIGDLIAMEWVVMLLLQGALGPLQIAIDEVFDFDWWLEHQQDGDPIGTYYERNLVGSPTTDDLRTVSSATKGGETHDNSCCANAGAIDLSKTLPE